MKKLVVSLALALLCIAALASCTETPAPLPQKHELTKVEAVAATCVQKGSVEYWHCAECNKDYKDANEAEEITEDEKVVPALGHDYGSLIAEVSPTCTENGVRAHYHCDRCDKNFVKSGNKYIERKDLTLLASHTLGDLVAAKEPTCAADGNAAYYLCDVCGKNLAEDKTTVLESVVIPKVEHDYQRVIVSPTFTTEGKDCTICKYCFEAKPGTTEVILNKRAPIDTTSIVSTDFTNNGTNLVKISVTAAKAGWYRVVLEGEPPRVGTYDGCILYNEAVQGIGFASGQRQPKEASGAIQPYYVWLNVGDNTLIYKRGSTASDTGKDQNGADLGYTTPNVTLTKATLAMVATEEIEVGLVLMDADRTGILPGQISATGSFGTPYTAAARNDFKPSNGIIKYQNVQIDADGYYFLFGMLLNYYGDNLFEIKFTKAGASEPVAVLTNNLKYDNIGKTGDVIEGSLVARKLMELGIVCLEAGTYTVEVRNAGTEDSKFLLGGLFLSMNTPIGATEPDPGETPGPEDPEQPAEHTCTFGDLVITAPTATEAGSAVKTCTVNGCGKTETKVIAARGSFTSTAPISVASATAHTDTESYANTWIYSVTAPAAGFYRVVIPNVTKGTHAYYGVYNTAYGVQSASTNRVKDDTLFDTSSYAVYVYLDQGENTVHFWSQTKADPGAATFTQVTKEAMAQMVAIGSTKNVTNMNDASIELKDTSFKYSFEVEESGFYYFSGMMILQSQDSVTVSIAAADFSKTHTAAGADDQTGSLAGVVGASDLCNGSTGNRGVLYEHGLVYLEAGVSYEIEIAHNATGWARHSSFFFTKAVVTDPTPAE